MNAGLRQIAFLIIPSAVAFVLLGDVISAFVYQSGHFHHSDAVYLWAVMAGSGVGLLATTMVESYNAAFYSLLDTRTPLRFAIVRVSLTLVLGYIFSIPLPPLLGIPQKWGVAGLTASAGISGWVEVHAAALADESANRAHWRNCVSGAEKPYAIALLAGVIAFAVKLQTAG